MKYRYSRMTLYMNWKVKVIASGGKDGKKMATLMAITVFEKNVASSEINCNGNILGKVME